MPYGACRRIAASLALLLGAGLAQAQDANLGRNLAATCANCHGTNGHARGDMRPLAGQPAQKIVAMLADFRSGAQPATIMHQIAKGYSDEQIRLIAAFFAAQPAK
ncbi:MAG TPA: cytochrome C [Rubrivivax sp.]|nr:cytochrome C [Rubrivivax sp.]